MYIYTYAHTNVATEITGFGTTLSWSARANRPQRAKRATRAKRSMLACALYIYIYIYIYAHTHIYIHIGGRDITCFGPGAGGKALFQWPRGFIRA